MQEFFGCGFMQQQYGSVAIAIVFQNNIYSHFQDKEGFVIALINAWLEGKFARFFWSC